jgi:hypothetical protein
VFMIARLYPSAEAAQAATAALLEAGYRKDEIAMISAPTAVAAKPVFSEEDDAAPAAQPGTPPTPAAASFDLATAVRAGKILGEHAEFYLSRLTDGRALVAITPSVFDSRRAEEILDAHDPLPDSPTPPKKPYVPLSEQATPLSNLLGMPTRTDSDTPLSDFLGFGFREEGLSHLSRWLKPLAPGFTFSSLLGMGTTASRDTFFPGSTRSARLEGQSSSFGLSLKARHDTPFSSLLGLPLLSKRKFFLYGG